MTDTSSADPSHPSEVAALPPLTDSWSLRTSHPVWAAFGLAAAGALVSVVVGVALDAAAPGMADYTRRLVAVLLVMAAALAIVAATKGWRRTSTTSPSTWRHVGLLLVPLLLAIAPAVAGFELPAAGPLTVFVLGYLGTGIFEEVWYRGVILDVLRGLGMRRSIVIGAAFFGLAHLTNVAFGQSLVVSLAQAFGAFCGAIGLGVLRWRTGAIWALAGIHAIADLMFKITAIHGGLLWGFLVGHDTLLLLWGLWCLRHVSDDVSDA